MHPLKPEYFLPLGDILDDLREQGFRVGVDTYADLFRLLRHDRLLTLHDPVKTCSLLSPLLATNAEEQEIFYKTFWKHVKPVLSDFPQHKPPPAIKLDARDAKLIFRYLYIAALVIMLITIGISVFFAARPRLSSFRPPFSPDKSLLDDTTRIARIDTGFAEVKPAAPIKAPPQEIQLNYFSIADPDISYFEIRNVWEFRLKQYGVQVALWLVLVVCASWIVYLFYKRHRERIQLDKRNSLEGPDSWPVKTDSRIPLRLTPAFHRAAHLLRQRIQSPSEQLDVQSSILSTMRAGGFPTPVFKRSSRPAEYLLLVQENKNGMAAAYLHHLFREFGKNDIIVHWFSWTTQPSEIIDPLSGKTRQLPWLLYHFGESRLIICGDAAQAANDPLLKEGQFRHWADRAALTWNNIAENEKLEAEGFRAAPFGLSGLISIAEKWETGGEDPLLLPEQRHFVSTGFADTDLEQLRAYFTQQGLPEKQMLQWFAACAFYPELHWDILLHTGKMLSEEGHDLLSLDCMEALVRIHWFCNGEIPEIMRHVVYNDETIFEPDQRNAVLKSIVALLRSNMPDNVNSKAWHQRMLYILLLESEFEKDRKMRRKMIGGLREEMTVSGSSDQVVSERLLSNGFHPLASVLPQSVRNMLYPEGQAWKGWKRIWSAAGVFLLAVVVVSLLDFSTYYGNIEVRDSKQYFVQTLDQQSDWLNHLAAFRYNPLTPQDNPRVFRGEQEHDMAMRLLDSSQAINPKHVQTKLNKLINAINQDIIGIREGDFILSEARLKKRLSQAELLSVSSKNEAVAEKVKLLELRIPLARWLCLHRAGYKAEAEALFKQIDQAALDNEDQTLIGEELKKK